MSSENKYRQLDEAKIFDTLDRLRGRISERFPDSGLSRVAAELLAVLHETAALVGYLERPHWPIRIAAGWSSCCASGRGAPASWPPRSPCARR